MDATQDKRLFLIDAYAMIFRGYYALIRNPRLTSTGLDTSAIFGFTNSLIELIRREKPSHLAVVFDVGQASVRTDDYSDYKANRSETPEAIKIAIPYIHRILQAMHIPILGVEGYEADDVIGTIACKAEKEGYTTFMVTPDKDFAQLVTDKIKIYKPGLKGGDIEILGVEEVKAKYEIEDPKQVIDFLAMMGDAVDNIPGLDGVGEKTAMKFLKEFGNIETLLQNTDKLKGKLKEKVEASAERGILSKKLATIICDAPVEFHQEQYDLDTPDFDKVKEVFDEIEFRRLYENLYRAFASAPVETLIVSEVEVTQKPSGAEIKGQAMQLDLFANFEELDQATSTKSTIEHNDHLYQFVDNPKAQKVLVNNLLKQKAVCFDTETTSLNELEAELVGMSFSYKKGLAYYIPLSEDKGEVLQTLEIFRPFFEKEDLLKIAHNLKFDYKILKQYDITVKGAMFDTMIAHYLLNPDGRHGMDYLSEVYLNYKPVSIETIIGKKGKNQGTFRDADLRTQTDYAAEDADITFQLYELFAPQLKKENLEDLFFNIEMPLMEVLAKMELSGISLDEKWLAQESIDLENDLRQLETTIFEISGEEFNMNSPKQLGEILFEKMQLDPKAKKTKTGQYATSEDVLQKLSSKHEIIKHILEYRTYQKLKSTYVDALPSQIDKQDSRVHTNFSQTTAATGRLASVNPNLQNIPIRTLRGQQIRGAFVSGEGKKIISADYSQIELRLIAEISGEDNMIKAFQDGEDIHASTAAKLFKIPLEEVSKTQRSQAKTVNFGIIYGQGAFALAEQTGLSRTEAKQMIEAYFETYPKLKEYMAEQVSKARQIGYVETILGRKRHLKDINSNNFVVRGHAERNAVNAPVQGSAADVVKLAMIKIDKELEAQQLKTKMLLQVHDELVFESPIDEIEIASKLIKTEMERALETQVPLLVEVGVGNNWLEAH
ncbi:DNA polymerase I [Chryseobacterium carnipullorum]|uniref:DNA polymerase I n=1 Tax=Chryseobacterium carnipullorum TaxID=1124835 RepID=A0A1M7GFX4_CHRCU|nr:DNA polymerase I [Chryseobacterium carnipullorum]AZA46776.1 DNA polymerase I [Chryseobacterium carnipullorum]AZA66138.1 DNA polymerase I [Chryseobacterium carnipullorum]SHM15066.1 DNA polymerase I [Chryseobacterium carnipullorum]STD05738.1 DNA polymerase I [Chryseobacterium carnipullorum]HBV16086.1 DNA polymerase I [Chryseobacterium carnipullorum]